MGSHALRSASEVLRAFSCLESALRARLWVSDWLLGLKERGQGTGFRVRLAYWVCRDFLLIPEDRGARIRVLPAFQAAPALLAQEQAAGQGQAWERVERREAMKVV